MGYFDDGLGLPGTKRDANPLGPDASVEVRASDLNAFSSALASIRSALRGIVSAKGDLLVFTGAVFGRRAVGANGQVLTADSTEPDGVKWASAGAGGAYTAVDIDPAAGTFAAARARFVHLVTGGRAFVLPATAGGALVGDLVDVLVGPAGAGSITVSAGAIYGGNGAPLGLPWGMQNAILLRCACRGSNEWSLMALPNNGP